MLKPRMSPELQEKIKQAIAQGDLKPMSYGEYCAISSEQAIKMLKKIGWDIASKPITSELNRNDPAPAWELKMINNLIDGLKEIVGDTHLTQGKAVEITTHLCEMLPPEYLAKAQKAIINQLIKDGKMQEKNEYTGFIPLTLKGFYQGVENHLRSEELEKKFSESPGKYLPR